MNSGFLPLLAAASICCQGYADAETPPLPEAGLKLQADYQKAIDEIQIPVRDRYVAALTKLLDEATRAGKLDEALSLRIEINRITASSMLGRWTDKIGRGIMELRPDGQVANTNGERGHWEIREDTLFVIWDNGWRQELPIVRTTSTLRGKVIEPSGDSHMFVGNRPAADH